MRRRISKGHRVALGSMLAASLVMGCVHFNPKPVTPDKSLESFEARRLDDAGLCEYLEANHEPAPCRGGLWGLRVLTLVAFYYNPDLEVARAEAAAAQAATRSAGERENPSLTLAPGYNSTTSVRLITPWILTYGLDVPLTTAGKRRHRVSEAKSLAEAARWNLASAAWAVRSRVRSALVELSAQSSAALLGEQEAAQAEIVGLLERQLEAGAISAFELTQARLALAAARLAHQQAEGHIAAAYAHLAEAVGVSGAALAGVVTVSTADLGDATAEVPAAAAQREALVNRADVLAALAEYEASQAALRLEIAKQYPDIHIGPGFERDQGDNKWTLSLSLPLPVVSRNRGPIAEAEARRSAAAARFLAVQAAALAELEQALVDYQTARKGLTVATEMMAELDQHERVASARFAAGEVSRLELDAVRLERVSAALAHLDARVKAQLAIGKLEDAMQRSTELTQWLSSVPAEREVAGTGKPGHAR